MLPTSFEKNEKLSCR